LKKRVNERTHVTFTPFIVEYWANIVTRLHLVFHNLGGLKGHRENTQHLSPRE